MEITEQHWGIIINPKSGKKKFRNQRKELFQLLKNHHIPFDYRVTRFAGHASDIAAYFVHSGYKNILVLGGDGTVSETINGIFQSSVATQKIKLAIIPRGTGNDWGRYWGLTRNFHTSVDVFLKGKTTSIDIGEVSFSIEGIEKSHYFINSLGLGLDAKVVEITHRLKEIFGSHSILYSISLVLALFNYRAKSARVFADEKQYTLKMLTMSIANGCYSGGGLKQCPNAIPTDGELDTMLAERPGFWRTLSGLVYLFRSKILEHPSIHSIRSKELYIQCDKKTKMEADGIIVNGISPYKVKIIPSAIEMIIP